MKDAIYDAAKAKERVKDNAVNPLVQDGKKLVPSVTRVFAQNRDIYVYLQAYKPSAGSAAAGPTANATQKVLPDPLMAFVSLYSDGTEAFKTQPSAVSPDAATRLGVTPLSFSVSSAGLKPGRYDCQVTVVDPTTAKANFWRAPIVIAR